MTGGLVKMDEKSELENIQMSHCVTRRRRNADASTPVTLSLAGPWKGWNIFTHSRHIYDQRVNIFYSGVFMCNRF